MLVNDLVLVNARLEEVRVVAARAVVNFGVEHDNADDDLERIDEDLDLIEDDLDRVGRADEGVEFSIVNDCTTLSINGYTFFEKNAWILPSPASVRARLLNILLNLQNTCSEHCCVHDVCRTQPMHAV